MENQELDYINGRIENQLRIHWHWLKNSDYQEVHKFIMAIINNKNKSSDAGNHKIINI